MDKIKIQWGQEPSRTGGQSSPRPRRGDTESIAFHAKPTAQAITETFLVQEISQLRNELAAERRLNAQLQSVTRTAIDAEVASLFITEVESRILALEQSVDRHEANADVLLLQGLGDAELALAALDVGFSPFETE